MVRKGWSYKEGRRLSELAGSGKTLGQIVKEMGRTQMQNLSRGGSVSGYAIPVGKIQAKSGEPSAGL